tara:strand:- start:15522 stop:16379 length:858 start_codon:yes stop_codon:yes gene_type:complete
MFRYRFVSFFYESHNFWKLILFTHAFFLGVYLLFLKGSVYPGIGVQSIAYAVIFFLVNGNLVLGVFGLLIVFFEGKRSVLLCLVLTIFVLRMIRISPIRRLIYALLGSIVFLSLLSGVLFFIAEINDIPVINRINLINPFSKSFDLYLGSSGRFGELVSVFSGSGFGEILLGKGAGFTYIWDLGYANDQTNTSKQYLHMSMANYVVSGGLIGIVLSLYILKMPFQATNLNASWSVKYTAFGFSVYAILQGFFGFNFATDPYTWVMILAPYALTKYGQASTKLTGS